jgi:probable rRNA maturation factor
VRLARRKLQRALDRALKKWGGSGGDLSFAVVDDPAMRRLNRRFTGRRGSTDVLAFPLGDGPGESGEIVVCAEVARRQAARRSVSVWMELLLYCLHGFLHLEGHDDHGRAKNRRMRLAEREMLADAGLARDVVKRLVPDSMLGGGLP